MYEGQTAREHANTKFAECIKMITQKTLIY